MKTVTKEFNVIQDTVNIYTTKDASDEEALFIKGIANSGQEDRDGDVVTKEALESIAQQATNRNLHFEHGRRIKDIIGTITEASIVEAGVEIVARIRNRCSNFVQELLDDGIKLGFSIAGLVEYEENNFTNIISWDLTEVSLVAIPCDPNTMGTVTSKSFISALMSFKQASMEVEKMADEITIDDVTKLINEAVNEIREEFDGKLEEINTKISELEAAIAELQPAEPAGEEGGNEGEGEESLSLDEQLETMKKELHETIVKTVDDNLLEFVTKAFNKKEDSRQPSFKFVDTAKKDEDGEEKVLSSAEMADLIIKGQI